MKLSSLSFSLRKDVIDMIYKAKTGHIGGDFSVMEILVVLYFKHMNVSPDNIDNSNRDRFILSKGHCVESLYCVLAKKGFISKDELKNYSVFNSKFIGHPNNKVNGIEMNTGSLGHGLSISVGMALAAKKDEATNRVYTVMGDGELAEGSVWEGAMAAGHYHLDNLTAIIDRNRFQISGCTEDVMAQENLDERWNSFGWNVIHAKGNDIDSLDLAIQSAKETKGKPSVIIADTVKGYGVSFMENDPSWHHRIPNQDEYQKAIKELNKKEVSL